MVTAGTLGDELRIEDPDFYLGDPYPHYARLRAADPVHLRPDLRIWLLTRYDDILSVSKQPVLFSCARGFFLNDALSAASVANAYFAGTELIATVDPPRHNELRRVISPAFLPRRIAALEDFVRGTCAEIVAGLPAERPVDFIGVAAEILPLVVISRLLGLSGADLSEMARWSDELMKLGRQLSQAERDTSVAVFAQMNAYMTQQFAIKRARPAEDLLTTLLNAELDSSRLSEENVLMWASVVLAGGNETTRALLGNAVDVLAGHPDQLSALAADRSLGAAAVEETLRWNGPVLGFCRYVAEDTELHGRRLSQGDWVYMIYPAANRDPEIFDQPERFDITVPRGKPNLAFGVGQHFCPGNLLARLEARVMLEELTSRFPAWSVAGDPEPIRSTFRSGYLRLPVTFHETS
jgi:cytochrome P450